jgi:hypothetical protein
VNETSEFVEDRIPVAGIEQTARDLVELYGGSVSTASQGQLGFVLPLRRGIAAAGGVACTLSWTGEGEEATATLSCDRDIDAPRVQRIALLVAGVIGALLWTLWPFFPHFGPLAWTGGLVALAAYFLSLRRTAGGIAADFLQRLARLQREAAGAELPPEEGEGDS